MSKLRLTKQQRAYQEQVLTQFMLTDHFKPSAKLIEDMASKIQGYETECAVLLKKLVDNQCRSLWGRILDWWNGQ